MEASSRTSSLTQESSKNQNQNQKHDPAIPPLGIYLKKTKTLIRKGTCVPVFIAALFTIAKIWKQPKYPLTDEWTKKMWYIYTMDYYPAIKKKEILPFCSSMDGLGGYYAQ